MKVYKYSLDNLRNYKDITITEIEVREKEKTYQVLTDPSTVWVNKRIIHKDEIGVINNTYQRAMYTLSPDDKINYINLLIEENKTTIDSLRQGIIKLEQQIADLESNLQYKMVDGDK